MISADERYTKRKITVNGKQMAYVDVGEGDPIVFLHGNPTSSYLWRNIMPYAEKLGRCIAPDLIGMGDSDKLDDSGPNSYMYLEHRDYIDGFLSAVGVKENVTLVIHDWGSVLGMDWARRHPEAIKGIAYMEAIIASIPWQSFPAEAREAFQGFKSPAGEAMVLDDNIFVEGILPGMVARGLTEAEMQVYRRPYAEPGESRRPTLTWPRELPVGGEPKAIIDLINENSAFMSDARFPKLLVMADPGAILIGDILEMCRTWPNQTEVTVPGLHFLQEDSPDQIGEALAEWWEAI